jgi:hypothetical protein
MRVPRFLIQSEGEFSAFIRPRSWPGQQHIRPASASQAMSEDVVPSPSLDLGSSVRDGQEPVCVQALVAKATVERLYERIVGGLGWGRSA